MPDLGEIRESRDVQCTCGVFAHKRRAFAHKQRAFRQTTPALKAQHADMTRGQNQMQLTKRVCTPALRGNLPSTKQKKFTTIENSGKPLVCTLTLWAVLFLMPLDTPAQVVNIPDTNLRAAIAEALDKAPGATITADEMATLTHLEAHDRGIRDLTGLEAATHLKHLRLPRNLISDLSPLAGLINLGSLSVWDNLITDLSPVEGLINLRGLEIMHNPIYDLSPIAGLINLHALWMGDNILGDLSPLTGLISLTIFYSSGTPIFNLSALTELPSLRKVVIAHAEISDISPLAGSTTLKELYLRYNEISDFSPLLSLTGLTHLSLQGSEVSDLSFLEGLNSLTWLELTSNSISDVSPLSELNSLTWLDLSDNAITDVSPLSELDSLTRMGLSDNAITDVSALASLRSLTWLELNGNAIADVSDLERFSVKTSIANFINAAFPEAGPKIEGPWLWVIVPGPRLDNTDLLAKASKGAVTEVKVATFGATEGEPIGGSEWTAHNLSPTGGDNINEMTDALGWGRGREIYEHVVYGSVTLNSPREQNTTMLVGSNGAVKVWLNGELVHYNPVLRKAGDYQDAFPVTLKQGANVLLVAVDNTVDDEFSGFFGFAQDTEYTVNPQGTPIVIAIPDWDVNKDGQVSILDLILVGQDLEKATPTNARTDVNGDGTRNIQDLVLVAQHLGELSGISAAPSALAIGNMGLEKAVIRAWIAQAQAENDGSLAVQQGIANLKRLLATMIPERTTLLVNYPNPFNPETWIPYQLARESIVKIHIYAATGALVRTLNVGHQPAGRYQERSRAAYWDGKNESGEPVASGVYFYTLTAGDFTATRKMLIRK